MPDIQDVITEKPELQAIKTAQDTKYSEESKYQQFLKDEALAGTEVHVYEGPNGPGYVIFEYEERQDGVYARATGEGAETASRTFDWTLMEKQPAKK